MAASSIAFSQDESIALKTLSFEGTGGTALNLKSSFTSAVGYGGIIEGRVGVRHNFTIGVQVGYEQFSLDQHDPVTAWNWTYWIKYYRPYINTDWLGDSLYFNGAKVKTSSLSNDQITSGTPLVRKDSVYQATLKPVQYITVIPLGVTFNYDFSDLFPGGEFSPFASIGLHMFVFDRNLYLDEQWAKRRVADVGPDSGQMYTFQYGYHNYAPSKKGETYGISARIGTDVNLSDLLAVRVSGEYYSIFSFVGKSAYNDFPMAGYVTLNVGIVIRY